MTTTFTTIAQSLEPLYKIQPISRADIETFKANYTQLLGRVEESEKHNESEENFKNHLMDFLKNTYYKNAHLVAPKGKTDFVIHKTNEAASPAAILFEVKRPKNTAEMVSKTNLNAKAMHELLLYYFEERASHQNNDITHLVITNIYEWFVFEASVFEQFYKTPKIKKEYTDWKEGRKVSRNNELFYKEIAQPALKDSTDELKCTYFDLRTFQKTVSNQDLDDDKKLIEGYKIFSPAHLLKLQTAADANKLNNKFYAELLHLIGLEEVKEGGKKLIQRKKTGTRHDGSLLENAINIVENEDRLPHITDLLTYGNGKEEQLFNVGLELCITWINRILFLKLLEAQLKKYSPAPPAPNGGAFLCSSVKAPPLGVGGLDFDVLNKLFFQVLAKPAHERSESIKAQFGHIPYLNSSLFEISALENDSIRINSLDDSLALPLLKNSVLRHNADFKDKTQLNTLHYLLAFLDAYDFASENQADIIEENRELISASVLGLIFEKINGYRDGSFYTPAFITEYMCRETITKAVIQKFNSPAPPAPDGGASPTPNPSPMGRGVKKAPPLGAGGAGLSDIYNAVGRDFSILEANRIFNSLHICDPAVGSGHFLVSALNVLIHLKAELGILADRHGKRLRVRVAVVNDELLVYDEYGEPFQYVVQPNGSINPETQRVQETLFHEKETLIENCLFGVDINPNSVKICRLRLWIELLKHAYYTAPPAPDGGASPTPNPSPMGREVKKAPPSGAGGASLQTLPNIDINIKQGNSLLSRYKLDEDLSEVFQKQRFSLQTYRDAVQAYKDSKSKEAKAELLRFINEIKEQFKQTVSNRDPRRRTLSTLRGNRALLDLNADMFGNKKLTDDQLQTQKIKLDADIQKIETQMADVEQNRLFRGSFEWRFEFPEVLDDHGNFTGFDVVIGNPPYGVSIKGTERAEIVKHLNKVPDFEIYYWFINLSRQILRDKGKVSYIIPNTILFNVFAQNYRLELFDYFGLDEILDCTNFSVFDEAMVRNIIFLFTKNGENDLVGYRNTNLVQTFAELSLQPKQSVSKTIISDNNQNWGLIFKLGNSTLNLITKIRNNGLALRNFFPETSQGLIAYDKYQGQDEETIKNRIFHSEKKVNENYKCWLWGEDITRFSVLWNGVEFINYCDRIANPREPKFFVGNRILIREITNPRIYAAFSSSELYNDPSIIIIKDNPLSAISCFSLLGILNSKLASFYHFNSSPKATKGSFPKMLVYDVNNFPLPNRFEDESFESLDDKVNQILTLKKADAAADTRALEAEIDALVYALYGLSAEEVAVVEGRG